MQLQVNYLDWESPVIQSRQCCETAKRHGKPVIVMEPLKGGTLVNIPAGAKERLVSCRPDLSAASWGIRFAASQENVMLVLSGMSSLEQVANNMAYMENFTPLNPEERTAVAQVVDIINASIAIPCTGCSYCIHDCPKSIAIPKYFSLYNADRQELESKDWTAQSILFGHLAAQSGRPGDCIACGQCEEMCPQHLPIREWLKKVSAHFEK